MVEVGGARRLPYLLEVHLATGGELGCEGFGPQSSTRALRDSAVPWLLLRGSLDRSINRTLDSTLAVIEGREDASLVDLGGAGHFANLEQPQGFDNALEGFISRHTPSTG